MVFPGPYTSESYSRNKHRNKRANYTNDKDNHLPK